MPMTGAFDVTTNITLHSMREEGRTERTDQAAIHLGISAPFTSDHHFNRPGGGPKIAAYNETYSA